MATIFFTLLYYSVWFSSRNVLSHRQRRNLRNPADYPDADKRTESR